MSAVHWSGIAHRYLHWAQLRDLTVSVITENSNVYGINSVARPRSVRLPLGDGGRV